MTTPLLLLTVCIASALAGCSRPPVSAPPDDSSRIAEDAKHLPELRFSQATTRPIAVRYGTETGGPPPAPGPNGEFTWHRPVLFAVWGDGLILWRQSESDWRSPLYQSHIGAEAMARLKTTLNQADAQARQLKMRSAVPPDASTLTIAFSPPATVPVALTLWREDDDIPADRADDYRALMATWTLARDAMAAARPSAGQAVNSGEVQWIEPDRRNGHWVP